MMGYFEVLVLAIVQGISEFLPISSSGHFVLFESLLNTNLDVKESLLLNVLLHFATVIAIIIYFRNDLLDILSGFFNVRKRRQPDKDNWFLGSERKLVVFMMVSLLPTVLVGYAIKETFLFDMQTPGRVGCLFLITGIVLWLSQKTNAHFSLAEMKLRDAFLIGLAQGVTVLPGISRSGITICIALFLGLRRDLAVKYSLLLSIPTILGVTLVESFEIHSISESLYVYLFGMVVAGLTGYFAILWIINFVRTKRLHFFSPYLWILGTILVFNAVF